MKKMVSLIAIILICTILGGCTGGDLNSVENDVKEPSYQVQPNDGYVVDYLKISPMFEENIEKDVLNAASKVIKAFLNYESQVTITINGNKTRFLGDLGYVINSTCPMFSAFTDYNEVASYDEEKNAIIWNYFISRDEFQKKVADFTKTVEGYLSLIDQADSDAMKAILLYHTLIFDASYDYDILGDAYEKMEKSEYRLRESPYNVLVNKTGICTNLSQALMFLYTQADLKSGTILHQGGVGAHMWVIVEIDEKYYYCDPTWDVGDGLKTFGITADDRSSWAGGYSKEDGRMLTTVIAQKYKIDDNRFATLREKIPVEITNVRVDKTEQTITFEGYDYEYTFCCTQ
jgi:hypothetical protein